MELTASIYQLRKYITSIYPFTDDDWAVFAMVWQPFSAKRKTMLTAAVETENYLYFVTGGLQRGFYLHDNDKEATIVFTYPYSFSGMADSFLTRKPSACFFERLPAALFCVPVIHKCRN